MLLPVRVIERLIFLQKHNEKKTKREKQTKNQVSDGVIKFFQCALSS